MVTDPVSDFIIRLKNGSAARKPSVSAPYSRFAENIAHALLKAGYVSAVKKEGKGLASTLSVELRYLSSGARIHDAERLSKPSRRMYWKFSDIRSYKSGYGNVFLSTPVGVLTDAEARKQKVGGEVLFRIW